MVVLLKERAIDDITIAEGTVLQDPKDIQRFEAVLQKILGLCLILHARNLKLET